MAAKRGVTALKVCGPSRALTGRLRMQGDKSISHRALLLAGMAEGTSTLSGVLQAGVTQAMLHCLRRLGIRAEYVGQGELRVEGGAWRTPAKVLDCANSGTTMRMLLGAVAGQPLRATLSGSRRLMQRPMRRVVEPLREMGADITGSNGGSRPPLTVHGGRLHGIEHAPRVASAQVKTALLLAGLSAEGPTTIIEPAPSRDHTERLLGQLGVPISVSRNRITLQPVDEPLPPLHLTLVGDISSAAFPLVAACLVAGSQVRIDDVGVNPTRTGLLDALISMGATVRYVGRGERAGEDIACVSCAYSALRGIEIGGHQVVRMIDEFPIFAVAATQASGESVVRGAAELRHKESDRISELVDELRKLGADIEEFPDGFRVMGPVRLQGARVDSHGDHRLAMALCVAGLVGRGETIVENAECLSESYPEFIRHLTLLGAEIQ